MSLADAVRKAVNDLEACADDMEMRVMKSRTVPKRPYKNFVTYLNDIRKVANTLETDVTATIQGIPSHMPACLQNEMKTLRYTESPKIYEASVDRCVNGQLNHYFSFLYGCAVTPQGTFKQALTDSVALANQNDWSMQNNPRNDDSDDDSEEGDNLFSLQPSNAASTSAAPTLSRVPSRVDASDSTMKFTNIEDTTRLDPVSPPRHLKDCQQNFFPDAHSTPPHLRENPSVLEGVALDRHNRLYATDSKIRKPDFLVDKKHIPLVIVEDKIDNARRAVQQLIDYMMEFREAVMNPGDPKPLGLCYVLYKSKGLRVAMLRESEAGEIVGIGSEDATPDRLFESLDWHDPTSDEVHNMLLSVFNTSLTL